VVEDIIEDIGHNEVAHVIRLILVEVDVLVIGERETIENLEKGVRMIIIEIVAKIILEGILIVDKNFADHLFQHQILTERDPQWVDGMILTIVIMMTEEEIHMNADQTIGIREINVAHHNSILILKLLQQFMKLLRCLRCLPMVHQIHHYPLLSPLMIIHNTHMIHNIHLVILHFIISFFNFLVPNLIILNIRARLHIRI
jgi:hypothetical protein